MVLGVCKIKETFLHMWWECEESLLIWDSIFTEIWEITGEHLQKTNELAPLSLYQGKILNVHFKPLIRYLLIPVGLVIARFWKGLTTQYQKVWQMVLNEKLTNKLKMAKGKRKKPQTNLWWKVLFYYTDEQDA